LLIVVVVAPFGLGEARQALLFVVAGALLVGYAPHLVGGSRSVSRWRCSLRKTSAAVLEEE
jgi:hypothetical protein